MKTKTHTAGLMYFLNRSYFICSHLSERLDELKSFALLQNFHKVISITLNRLDIQISQYDTLFMQHQYVPCYDDCEPLISFMESLFTQVQVLENTSAAIALLDYVSITDALLKETAKFMTTIITHLQDTELYTQDLYSDTMLHELKVLLKDFLNTTQTPTFN